MFLFGEAGQGRQEEGGQEENQAGLTWHPPGAGPEVWVLLQPTVAVTRCRAECFGQRSRCLLNRPPPACRQWGAVVTAPALGGRLPSSKPPPSPCASALPAQGFLLAAVQDADQEVWSAWSWGLLVPEVAPAPLDAAEGAREGIMGGSPGKDRGEEARR